MSTSERSTPVTLSVVILNFRTAELVIDCLASLAGERERDTFEVVVVDNNSGDGSAEKIQSEIARRSWSGWARLVRSPENNGFSAGNNFGVIHSRGDLVLLLNSDTVVRPGAIAELVRALEACPEAGIIGPRLEWPDGTAQESAFRWPRPTTELERIARTGLVTRLFKNSVQAIGVPDEPRRMEWVSFAAVMIRRELFESIGTMDEGFFMYYEDVDFCRRAVGTGSEVWYWPAASIVHLRGGSSPVKALTSQKKRRPAYFYASRNRYYGRYYGRVGLWWANVCWIIGRAISLPREWLERKEAAACESEWRDIWTNALRPLATERDLARGD